MRHPGTKPSKPAGVHGYGWYDAETGRIDRARLAREATRQNPPPAYAEPPAWLDAADIPERIEGASPLDLARVEARARRAFVHASD
ncbi:MAG: hypothetical protein AAGA54_05605 [Myxococcota bacterium]